MISEVCAIICGVLIMMYVASRGARRVQRWIDARMQQPEPRPRPWTVRPVSTPMLAEYGVPCLYHVYDPAGNHSCDPSSDFCYLTRTEAEAAARLGEQFTAVVVDATSGGAR